MLADLLDLLFGAEGVVGAVLQLLAEYSVGFFLDVGDELGEDGGVGFGIHIL